MKAIDMTVMADSLQAENKQSQKNILRPTVMAALLLIFLLPITALATTERYVLQFYDNHILSYQNQPATLFLKKSLKQQYPNVDIAHMELKKVVLVAKTNQGRGGAQLRVGDWLTKRHIVNGQPRFFQDHRPFSFDRIAFNNPSRFSNGPWQVDLNGNFIVRKVVVEVENHSWSRHHMRWDH